MSKKNSQELYKKLESPYNTASACIKPITDGICPESWLPCKDLSMYSDLRSNITVLLT